MKKYNLHIFLLLVFTSIQAKEISLDETIAFLQTKLNVYHTKHYTSNGHNIPFKVSQSFINNGNCNFTIRIKNSNVKKINDIDGELYLHLKNETIFNAKDLDPEKIKVYQDWRLIGFGTFENKENIMKKIYVYEPKERYLCTKKINGEKMKVLNSKECIVTHYNDNGKIEMMLSPINDNRPRVVKAMKHLIKICGGKEELF